MSQPTNKQIAIVIDQFIADGKIDEHKISAIVAAYLVDERRTRDLDAVLRATSEIRSSRGIIEATARSAYPVDTEIRAKLEDVIRKEYANTTKIIIDKIHDRSVVGGVKLDTSEIRIDASVQGKLQHLTLVNDKV